MSSASKSLSHPISRSPAAAWYMDASRWRLVAIEIVVTAMMMGGYFLIRGLRPDNVPAALDRSLVIIHFEQQVGLFQEVRWQEAFLPHHWLMDAANLIYAWGHYPVLLAIALWLVIKDPARFRFLRNVLLVSALIGIFSYWIWPAAPPRLMESLGYDFGFVDTVHGATSNTAYFQPGPFVNDYAAVPSFHFGWIALASVAIWTNTRLRWARAAAVLMSVLMWWAVTVTGNHFFFDMVMGGLVVGASWLAVAGLSRLPYRRLLQWRLPPAPVD